MIADPDSMAMMLFASGVKFMEMISSFGLI